MTRPTVRRTLPALFAMLCLVAAGTFVVAAPSLADTGSRDSQVNAAILQNGSPSGITVGGQLEIGVNITDHSGSCINFDDCDNPLGTVDVVLQDAGLPYNQTIASLNLTGVVHDASQALVTIDNPLPAGTYHVDAHYNGDPNFHPNDGTLDNVKVAALTPDVGIAQSTTSSYQGEPVTFSTTVSSPNGVHPTGTVQLIYGTTDIGGPLGLDGSGQASITRSDLPLSDTSGHTYYFHYSGDSFLNPADSASIDHRTLAKIATTTGVSVTSPVRQDDPVSLTAGVSAAGGVDPPGSVTFTALYGGTLPIASATVSLSGGVANASFAANTLLVGPYTVAAQYNPSDPGYAASSAGASLTVTPAVPLGGVDLAVSAAPSPGVLGAPETVHVIATPPTGSTAAAEGTVDLATGSAALGTCTLASASGGTTACDLITSDLPAGVDPITATYSGSSHFASVSGSTSVTITEPSTTTLIASPTTAASGKAVTLTAQVDPQNPVPGEPTGTVAFRDGGGLIGSATVDASGAASLITTKLPIGDRTIIADYSGDAVVEESQSAPVTVTITALPTTHPSGSSTHPSGSSTHPSGGSAAPSGSSATSNSASGTSGGSSGRLADTGARGLVPLSTGAAMLLALGAAFGVVGRRRRPIGRHR